MTSLTEKSKFLAYILRHRPEAAKLTLNTEGWCSIDQLVANTDITRAELLEIVDTDDKGRYSLDQPITSSVPAKLVRANQGHSTKGVKLTFTRAVPPVTLFHGTASKVLSQITKEGLKPMNRHHVHLSADIEVAKSVGGRRKGDVTILKIDAKQMLADGHKFFLSDNGVWLVDSVNPKYITAS